MSIIVYILRPQEPISLTGTTKDCFYVLVSFSLLFFSKVRTLYGTSRTKMRPGIKKLLLLGHEVGFL